MRKTFAIMIWKKDQRIKKIIRRLSKLFLQKITALFLQIFLFIMQ